MCVSHVRIKTPIPIPATESIMLDAHLVPELESIPHNDFLNPLLTLTDVIQIEQNLINLVRRLI